MITVSAISFSCNTIEEAVALAKRLGLGQQSQPQTLPSSSADVPSLPAPSSVSASAQDNPAWPTPTTSAKSASSSAKKRTSKFAATIVKAKTVKASPGVDIDAAAPTKKTRVPNGAYDFLTEIKVGRSRTVALGASANLPSAFGRYRKHHEKDARFSYEKLDGGKFKVTRVE